MDPWMWLVIAVAVLGLLLGLRQQARRPARPVRPLDDAGAAEVDALLREGKQVSAIKRYRELTGADLVTAKNAVEQRAEEV